MAMRRASRAWIPAFAGMTMEMGWVRTSIDAGALG
jgi:hypothetical protein